MSVASKTSANLLESAGRAEHLLRGCCFYPEQWPRETWPAMIEQMVAFGFDFVRIGEFLWSRIEPRRGTFDWSLLDDAVEALADAGLAVALGTPTASPPPWLAVEAPDSLFVDIDGSRRRPGSRRHGDLASATYTDAAYSITEAMTRRYGNHPAVIGWQIDNEFGDHDTGRSWSTAALCGFQHWLAGQYETIAALNDAWGAVFWSQEYSDWDQIPLPHQQVAESNPAHVLDFWRYSSWTIEQFVAGQAAIIRANAPGRWVTHNAMRLCDQFDHYQIARHLDFITWDSYPTGAIEYADWPNGKKNRWARTGEPDLVGFNHDMYREMSQNRAFWVMEQQVGQINWAPFNVLPESGAIRLWYEQVWAHGGTGVCAFRWKAATAAQEVMHSGLLRHDGSVDRGGLEIAELDLPVTPEPLLRSPCVLLHDYDSLWLWQAQPHHAGATYWQQVMLYYGALRSLGIDVDVRHPDMPLAGYELIVAPALLVVNDQRAASLTQAVADGAHLICGPRTGSRTISGRVPETGQPGALAALLGCRLANFDSLRPGMSEIVDRHEVEMWAESYQLTSGIARNRYASGPLLDEPAVVRHERVLTIGAWSESLIAECTAEWATRAGLPIETLPEGVRVSRQSGEEVWLNFASEPWMMPSGIELDGVSSHYATRKV